MKSVRVYMLNAKKFKAVNNADYNGSLKYEREMCLTDEAAKAILSGFMREARRSLGD